jgi:hypothetical protein
MASKSSQGESVFDRLYNKSTASSASKTRTHPAPQTHSYKPNKPNNKASHGIAKESHKQKSSAESSVGLDRLCKPTEASESKSKRNDPATEEYVPFRT